jgi:beta-glucuronidase
MVWNEIPAWQTAWHVLGDEMVWETYGAPQLSEMVAAYRLHPSVVVWSSCNEVESNRDEVIRYVEKASKLIRQLDRTRLVTFASNKRTADLAFGFVDFIAVNAYFGHYGGKIEDLGTMLDEVHHKWPDKPIVMSEFGTESVLGWSNPAPSQGDGSEDYHVRLISDTFDQAVAGPRREFMAGMIYWLYADYPWKDTPDWLASRPPAFGIVNCKGVVTQDRRHKKAWSTLQHQFRAFGP